VRFHAGPILLVCVQVLECGPKLVANPEHFELLQQGVDSWNAWRRGNPSIVPDLSGADLRRANLIEADLSRANLSGANLSEAKFAEANLRRC
jgi:Pentapeptide repeats (8 copies)